MKAGEGRTHGESIQNLFCALLALRFRHNTWAGDGEKRCVPLPLLLLFLTPSSSILYLRSCIPTQTHGE